MAHALGELRRQLDQVFAERAAERAAAEVARRLLETAERGRVVPQRASRDPAWLAAVAAFISDPAALDEA
jgi:hypothetical protein